MISGCANHLWQSTLCVILAAIIAFAFRKNGAQVRYWLWFAASLKFLIPFSFLVGLGGRFQWSPDTGTGAHEVTQAIDAITQPFASSIHLVPTTTELRAEPSIDLNLIWIGVWACGFLAVALTRLRSWLAIGSVVRSSTRIDLSLPVEVRSAAGLLEPGVVGLLRPRLLLPAGILERLTAAQLAAVLAHELCHIRRRDNLLASIHMIVEAVFWFYPLVWWLGARLIEEREHACDEEVLRSGSEPCVYAEAILKVCKFYAESPLTCVSGVTGADIEKRVHAIISNRAVFALNLQRKAVLCGAGVAALALPIIVGTLNTTLTRAATTPKFEVASVRPCKDEPNIRRAAGEIFPGRLNTGCTPLVDEKNVGLIQRAYVRFADSDSRWKGITPILGGPEWLRSQLYVINAKAEGSASPEVMQGPMLRTLLEDRFKLKLHRETREVPAYKLTVARDGSKLKPFEEGSCVSVPVASPRPALPGGQQYCRVLIDLRSPSVRAQGSTLDEFSKLLELVLERPVIDSTGMNARFDIRLDFAHDEFTPGLDGVLTTGTPETANRTSIFVALQQQLGLKLVPAQGSREFIIIDHIERPSAN